MSTRRLAWAVVLALIGGCGQEAPQEGEGITLTVWDWHAADPSKGVGLWLTRIDAAFERAHPGVKINHVAQSHTEYYQILKAAASAKSGPDVVMLHQGSRVVDERANLLPLTEFVTSELRRKLVGWEMTSLGYSADGTPLAVPIAVQGLVWYYNRDLLKQAGFDPDAPPSTWSEFLRACEAARKLGKAGIAAGQKEGFWAEWFINLAYFQTFAPGDAERLARGDLKWTDPKVLKLLAKLKELQDHGCFARGVMSTPLFPDAGEVFMRGDALFFLGLISDVAHWKEFADMMGRDKVGVMTCPVFELGPRADWFPTGGAFAYALTAWCKHPREAFDYIAFIASDANARTFLSEVGSFPANQSYDPELIRDPNAKTIAAWLAAGKTGPQLTATLPMEVGEALRRECQRLMSGQTTVPEAAEEIEKTAAAARARK